MKFHFKRFILPLLFISAVSAQSIQSPPHIDDLLKRASTFRQSLATGDRVKASELVVPAKRKDFLNKPPVSLENIRLVGVDFIDKDHISVRVTGQTVMSGSEGAQLTEPQVSDVWVYEKGTWYFQPDSGEIPFSAVFKKDAAADATALAEIKSTFKLLTQSLEVGEMWQGDHKDFPVQFEYSGSAPIRIVSKLDTPVTMIDTASTQWITKKSNQFKITAGSDDFDGPFDIPVNFTVYYGPVALEQSFRVKGSIRPMFKYRQLPETVPPDSKQEFQVFITNNTDESAEFGAFATDGKFFVVKYPHHVAPGEEAVITLKRNPVAGATPGTMVSISLDNQLKGRQVCEIRIH